MSEKWRVINRRNRSTSSVKLDPIKNKAASTSKKNLNLESKNQKNASKNPKSQVIQDEIDEGFVSNGSSSSSSAKANEIPSLIVSDPVDETEADLNPDEDTQGGDDFTVEFSAWPTLASDPIRIRSKEALSEQCRELSKIIVCQVKAELEEEEGCSIELIPSTRVS